MKEIPLSRGKVALVDDSDYEWLSNRKWWCLKQGKGFSEKCYAVTVETKSKKRSFLYMHRVIMGSTTLMVDHADRNGLNNQRNNLRQCTCSQNLMNQIRSERFDHYKGVCFNRMARKWHARIKKEGVAIHLGYFDYSTDAAIAYNNAAIKLHGEFARLNTIPT